jgi:hypothetical protein
MLAMSVLFDYFAAESDEEAAAVIDRVGGPGSQALTVTPSTVAYDTVSVKGVDPVVQLGTLEELLTGRSYDEIAEDPRSGHLVGTRDGGERVVCTITDSLMAALAQASSEALQRIAEPWSQTEEFWGTADPEGLAEILGDLAGLARRAQANGRRLYCWVCV